MDQVIKGPEKGSTREDRARDEIIHGAIAIFRDRGYEGASMRKIASSLGMTAPGIYYYFKNKQDLLTSCLESLLGNLLHEGRRAVDDHAGDTVAQLRAFVEAHIVFQFEGVPYELNTVYSGVHKMGTLTTAVSDEHMERIREIERLHLNTLRDILREGSESGVFDLDEPTLTAFAIIAVGEHMPAWFNPRGRLGLQGALDHAVRMVLRMVGATELNQ